MRLVADVGGTNSRLALAQGGTVLPDTSQSYANNSYASFDQVVDAYLGTLTGPRPTALVAAVAGPVKTGSARLTNRDWQFDETALKRRFGLENVRLINDLTAMGYAAPNLRDNERSQIVKGEAPTTLTRQSLVVGIGTGFNVSPVTEMGSAIHCAVSETGHMSLGLGVATHLDRLRPSLSQEFPTVEHCFSGRGFSAVCAALTDGVSRHPAELIATVRDGQEPALSKAIDEYAGLIGALTRDLVMAFLPDAGIYFCGSVAREVLSLPARSHFEQMLAKPFGVDVDITGPVWIITADGAALTGCANVAFPTRDRMDLALHG